MMPSFWRNRKPGGRGNAGRRLSRRRTPGARTSYGRAPAFAETLDAYRAAAVEANAESASTPPAIISAEGLQERPAESQEFLKAQSKPPAATVRGATEIARGMVPRHGR